MPRRSGHRAARRRAALLAPLVLAAALPACTAPVVVLTAGVTAAQVGATEFINGELENAAVAPFDDTFHATLAAMEELQFREIRSAAGERIGTIRAREMGGRSVRVEVERKTDVVTKINIRFGIFGDQSMSRLLLAAIQAHLPAQSVTAPDEPDAPPPTMAH